MYNVTRGTFGVDASGKPNVVWTGTDASSNVFYFDRPLPSVKGENMELSLMKIRLPQLAGVLNML